jgi:hypothetical protein
VIVEIERLKSGLGDLDIGAEVELDLALDKQTIANIYGRAAKGDLPVKIKSYSATTNTLLISASIENERFGADVELAFELAKDAKIRVMGRNAQATELFPGMLARLRLKDDRRTIVAVWADEPEKKTERKDDDD